MAPPWGRSLWVSYYRKQLHPGDKPLDHDEHVAALKANLSEPGRFNAFRRQAKNTSSAGAGSARWLARRW